MNNKAKIIIVGLVAFLLINFSNIKAIESDNLNEPINYNLTQSLLEEEEDEVVAFLDEKLDFEYTITLMESLKDIKGNNQFVLVEFNPAGYLIYDRAHHCFSELCLKAYSPYHNILGEKIYIAPTFYYCNNGTTLYDIISNEVVTSNELAKLKTIDTWCKERNLEAIRSKTQNEEDASQSTSAANDEALKTHVSIFPTGSLVPSGYTVPSSSTADNPFFFEKHHINHEIGYGNSCGYVAMGMVFSYYDCFVNDNLIPTSGEVKEEGPNGYSALSSWTESPGVTLLYSDSLVDFGREVINSTDSALNLPDSVEIIDSYIVDERGFSSNSYKIYYTHDNSLAVEQNNVKYLISTGLPVVVAIASGSASHAVVAYKYDSDGICVNYGYEAYGTSEVYIGNTNIYWAYALDFYPSHVHSDNYYFGYTSYCGCGYTTTQSHTHSHLYLSNSSLEHAVHCNLCNYAEVEGHTLGYITATSANHKIVCEKCDYMHSEKHNATYVCLSETQHSGNCPDCGYNAIEDHTYLQLASGMYVCRRCDHTSQFVFL